MGTCALDASSVPAALQDVLKGLATAIKLHVGTGVLLCHQAFWRINRTTKGSYGTKQHNKKKAFEQHIC